MIEDLFNKDNEKDTSTNDNNRFKLGKIIDGKVRFDGESTVSNKIYKRLNNITLNNNDRVLLAKVKGSFVILGKLT
ncbi:hypothetical protein SH1V18_14860 [Vallitalea longa]|uniref:Uncharacterized protein n=1 Tax=Vallitalea longa TaxID=2936439 RepID=A0A9W5YAM9_9FIRM|nr:hypothetical protein [Vallitalea longa]GKX29006.1 hypothetical protein SH1V18_14860 [Vallitalea longa]